MTRSARAPKSFLTLDAGGSDGLDWMGQHTQRQTESRVTPPEYIRRVLRQARRLWPFFIAGVIAAALIAYFAISFRVAETVTQVERVPLDPPASSIAATHEDVTFKSRDGSVLMTVQADPTIGPVVTDSAFADGNTVVSESATKYTNLPAWFTPGIVLMSRLFLGLDLSLVTPSKVVAAHPERPFLFIQCTDDTTVPLHHGLDLKAASANPRTELWVVPGCEHVMAYATHPDEWAQHVLGFLGQELGGEKPVVVPAGILAASPRGG